RNSKDPARPTSRTLGQMFLFINKLCLRSLVQFRHRRHKDPFERDKCPEFAGRSAPSRNAVRPPSAQRRAVCPMAEIGATKSATSVGRKVDFRHVHLTGATYN